MFILINERPPADYNRKMEVLTCYGMFETLDEALIMREQVRKAGWTAAVSVYELVKNPANQDADQKDYDYKK